MAVYNQSGEPYFHLTRVLKQLTTQLLGEQISDDLLQQIGKNPKILNALFDVLAVLYEQHATDLAQLPCFLQSDLVAILKQGRIVQPYFVGTSFIPLEQATDTGLQQSLLEDKDEGLATTAQKFPLVSDENSRGLDIQQIANVIDCLEPLATTKNPDSSAVQAHENNEQVITIAAPSLDTVPNAVITPITTQVIKMPHFQISNARVGQPYQAQIQKQGQVTEGVVVEADSVQVPPETGLIYDAENSQFTGLPALAGDFQIVFKYKHSDGAWYDGKCMLIITADPRSLWQVNEPAPSLPYPKAHLDHQLLSTPQFKLAAASRRGRSHEHAGSFRDDDFFIANIDDTAWSIMIVADGAGSAPYSREGSRIAVQTTGQLLADYLVTHHQQLDAHLSQWQIGSQNENTKKASQALSNCFYDLFYKATQQSIQQIEQLALAQEVNSKSFATTLLVAVVRQETNKTFISTFWIGDGAIAAYCPSKLRLMGTPDGGEFAGQTRFLDKSIAATFNERVNIGYLENLKAVILMTDGISDPKFETDAGLQNQQKWDALWQELQPSLQAENADQALLDWMHFFSAGHHDDRTLAILWPLQVASTNSQAQAITEDSYSTLSSESDHPASSSQSTPK